MALPNTQITVIGQISRPALNTDGIAGFLFYNDNIADLSVFTTTARVVAFTNLSAVEAVGITEESTNFKAEWYQLKEFFRAGGTKIYVYIAPKTAASYDFDQVNEMALFSEGSISLYAIYTPEIALAEAKVGALNTIMASFETNKQNAIALYAANTGTLSLTTLPDLRAGAASLPYVSVVIGQDTEGLALDLTTAGLKSVPAIGLILGTLAVASVSENILNVGKYNYTDGSNLVIPGLFLNNGVTNNILRAVNLYEKADLDELNDKGYIFFRYFCNYPGTYLSNDNNAAKLTDTFNSIHIMRVRNKAVRELDKALVPLVGSPLLFNSNGTLRVASRKVFEQAAASVLQSMQNKSEISAYSIFIDPTQNALATKTVEVAATIVPVESADYINIKLVFAQNI